MDRDWLESAALGGLMLTPPAGGLAALLSGLGLGAVAGALSAWPRSASLLAAPGLIPLIVLGLGLLTAPFTGPPSCAWGPPSWLFTAALLAAAPGLLAGGRRKIYALAWPWLAAAAVLAWPRLAPPGDPGRLNAILLPALFIIPALARSRPELLCGALAALAWGAAGPLPGLPPNLAQTLPAFGVALTFGLGQAFWRRRGQNGAKWPQAGRPNPGSTPAKARLNCAGPLSPPLAAWSGPPSCRLAAAHDAGPRLCPYGCLGYGDCRAACPHGAIIMDENGRPLALAELCQGCGLCRASCPRRLWELVEGPGRAFISCAAQAGLKQNAAFCPRACLGCGRCRKLCPAGAIGRAGAAGALTVNQKACQSRPDCPGLCGRACPRHLILASV
jgi:Fe-S-cluster-containing hydrogenase component 2